MKRIPFFVLFLISCSVIQAQRVGIGTNTPDSSALLEVKSTSKGFLPPRMTLAQRNAILTPAQGLIIYCTNCGTTGGEPEFYSGSEWKNLVGGAPLSLTIGENFGGGKVAYLFQPGDVGFVLGQVHGIVAAPSDQSGGIQWYNLVYTATNATSTAIGTGNANTNSIVLIQGAGNYAAKLCADLVLNGYDDWYLPSKDELLLLYSNRVAIGDFKTTPYWTSSEYDADINAALDVNFGTGVFDHANKNNQFNVRAVRAF